MKSVKTTASILGMVVAIITLVILPLCDEDPTTKPKVEEAIAIIMAGIPGIFAPHRA